MKTTLIDGCKCFLAHPFFHDKRTLLGLWTILGLLSGLLRITRSHNNFLIFRGVYWHTIRETSLYAAYPHEYGDVNHYGPLFSLIIAPFAIMPEWIGLVLWNVALALSLYVAISRSNLANRQQIFIYWFCAQTLLTSLFMQQFNITIAAIIIASFYLIEKERDFWAAFLIILGMFIKLYGIVGLAFFFFSKHKGRLVLALFFWALVCFVAPMLMSSPEYIVGQYHEWFTCLVEKNAENGASVLQNISAIGLFHRVSGCFAFSDLYIIVPALLLFALPYLRFSQYKNVLFRQTLLASVLLFVVLFSTGSESSSYIIALSGACIWYLSSPERRGKWDIALMIFVFLVSSCGSSDLFPRYVKKEIIEAFALKALPCLLVWLRLNYEMLTKDYTKA